ncbi:MAG TPA: hypothetical protein VHC90_20990 [Bryobacteraceae bacterium]|nr:hypothetical protein [Bryobacteraceae bacterium]
MLAAPVAVALPSAFAIEYNQYRLLPRLEGDYLHVAAANFSFLTGKSLQRLKDGASVAFVAQLIVSDTPNYLSTNARAVARFAVSYDIWEDRFSVTTITDRPEQKRTISHQLAPAAESWCLDNLAILRAGLPSDRPLYLRLDLRVEDPRDQAGVIGDSGISLSKLVEIFSRPVRDKQDRYPTWTAGPIRLEDIPKGARG